jgi:hypothetical protein
MARTALHIKVELEHGEEEKAEKLASEISRALMKIYGVRGVEISNIITEPD